METLELGSRIMSHIVCMFYLRLILLSSLVSASLLTAILGYPDGSVGAAIVAVVLIHTVIAGYVYIAWKDGPTTWKQD